MKPMGIAPSIKTAPRAVSKTAQSAEKDHALCGFRFCEQLNKSKNS